MHHFAEFTPGSIPGSIPGAIPGAIYLFTSPTDMRKSFDGLCGLIATHLKVDVTAGGLFVFVNRRRDRMKLMYFDVDGLAIWYKRLERGNFQLPQNSSPASTNPTPRHDVVIDARQLRLILDGVDLASVKHRKRYRRVQRPHDSGVTDDDRSTDRTTATTRCGQRAASGDQRRTDADGCEAAGRT